MWQIKSSKRFTEIIQRNNRAKISNVVFEQLRKFHLSTQRVVWISLNFTKIGKIIIKDFNLFQSLLQFTVTVLNGDCKIHFTF